jgi:hypothetical protein
LLVNHLPELLNPLAAEFHLVHLLESNPKAATTVATETEIGTVIGTGIEVEGTEEIIESRVVSVSLLGNPVIAAETSVDSSLAITIKEEMTDHQTLGLNGLNAVVNARQNPSNDPRSCYGPSRALLSLKNSLSRILFTTANPEMSL